MVDSPEAKVSFSVRPIVLEVLWLQPSVYDEDEPELNPSPLELELVP